jgi:GNAT superfamily N-acetyltransferase
MFKSSFIRSTKISDLPKLKVILDQTELFPSEMLEEMIHPFLHDPSCTDIWQVYEHNDEPIALLYCVKEQLTEGTWNVLALGVATKYQSQGIGELMMNSVEHSLRHQNQTTLVVDTSSLAEYRRSREFYERIGFNKEAVIRDFWAKGDHKITFWKSLS